jgi:quercetin dioxygenase-like cupin family protein
VSNPFGSFNARRPKQVWEGITARAVDGERMTMALVDLEPNSGLPPHQHENEQMGFVVEGELELTIDGETRTLRPGDTYVIPSNVLHAGATGPNGAVVCDVFAPIRADWAQLPESEPSNSSWSPG